MLVEEGGDLAEGFPGFGDAVVELILRVRHALEHLELGVDTGLAQFTVYADGVAQQQVAGSGGEDGGREAVHVTVDWGEQWVAEVVAVGVDLGGGVAEAVGRNQ